MHRLSVDEITQQVPPMLKPYGVERKGLCESATRGEMVLLRQRKDPAWLPSYRDVVAWFTSKSFSSVDWRQFCYDRERPVFELMTHEFVTALGNYIAQRVEGLHSTKKQSTIILEVGAGDGRLSYFLRSMLHRLVPGRAHITTTDSGVWKSIDPVFPVERLDCRDALQKYKPRIVLCSWMPYQHDWTAAMRATTSVEEYILIGETDEGCCGHSYYTWGSFTFPSAHEIKAVKKREPPYATDGFQRRNLDEISRYQFCRSDYPDSYPHSKTVSFRRVRRNTDKNQKRKTSRDFLDRENRETPRDV